MRSRPVRWLAAAGAATAALPLAANGAAATATPADRLDFVGTSPSTVTLPYVRPVAAGVDITSLLTVDDARSAKNGYEMAGIPDGLGAYPKNDNVVVLMNHELNNLSGVERRHGEVGAFVSRLVVNPENGRVLRGRDLIDPGVKYWDYLTSEYADAPNGAGTQDDGDAFVALTAAFNRFCSASLTTEGQLYDADTGTGYDGRIYFANEEAGDEGRLFGVTTAGKAVQLPRLGLFSWENTLAAPNQTETTLVMGNEDVSTGQLRAYVGQKTSTGRPVTKAGLTNGANFVIDLLDETVDEDAEFRTTYGKGSPQPFDLSEVDWDKGGVAQNAEAAAEGITLNRIEDGEFDPNNPDDYYFLTTEGAPYDGGDAGGLWKLSWADIERPELGGTLELVLDGSEGLELNKPDNMTIDALGNLMIQEDPGEVDDLARVLAYRISDGAYGVVAEFHRDQFLPGAPDYLTNNEESSGIIDTAALFGAGTFLFDAQVHTPPTNNVTEYVERGQLMKMTIEDWSTIYGS